ncbi:MAG: response regulator [Euryarchaeota archaeon]|nr:response regulator [Euryarchaeota archaeon]
MAKILLVDDEPEMRFITRKMLEKAGHTVVEACSGEECLARLEEELPDLILLDVMMPGDDGWEVCRKIKSQDRTRGIPVVMFTVRTEEEDMLESTSSGADAHINKPFERDELLGIISRILGDTG